MITLMPNAGGPKYLAHGTLPPTRDIGQPGLVLPGNRVAGQHRAEPTITRSAAPQESTPP
ncbi:hypothetical protein ACIRRA_29870 [Nocardia sp. NPDC101769]|uniref:hypothetical protein n=1 Tax=Nocardia sp. NPDC101769 TaxID=3364333 RepID=UPI00380F0902